MASKKRCPWGLGSRTGYSKGCRCNRCTEAQRIYHKGYTATERGRGARQRSSQRVREDRRRRLNLIKQGMGCFDCGYNEHAEALHFDHVRGEKSFEISKAYKNSWKAILKEIQKCDVRCANCHAIKTAERRKK